MDNNNIDKTQEQEKSFITEKIKPKTRRKIKKVLEVCGLALLAAVIIGFVSRIVFELSEEPVEKMLGVEDKQPENMLVNPTRGEVKLSVGNDPGRISPSIADIPTPSPEPEKKQADDADPSPTPTPSVTPTPEPSVTDPPVNPEKKESETEAGPSEPESGDELLVTLAPGLEEDNRDEGEKEPDPMDDYNGIVGGLKDLYSTISESIVTVRAFNSGVNWLDENIETYADATGVVLGENGVELLVMTSFAKTENADRIEVILNSGFSVEGKVFITDQVLDLAIVAVELDNITAKEKAAIRCICIGDSSKLTVGDSIMAAGMPDGYSGSMAYGFVSATGRKCYVQEGVLDVFATGLPYHTGSDAVIVNMSGEMVGMISHYAEQNEDDRITTCVAVNSIRDILIALLNGKNPVRPGIRAEDMPADVLKSMGLENGIYINEVVSGSPAAEAGLRKGDIITSMDGTTIGNVKDMMEFLVGATNHAQISTAYFRSSLRDEPMNTVVIELVSGD